MAAAVPNAAGGHCALSANEALRGTRGAEPAHKLTGMVQPCRQSPCSEIKHSRVPNQSVVGVPARARSMGCLAEGRGAGHRGTLEEKSERRAGWEPGAGEDGGGGGGRAGDEDEEEEEPEGPQTVHTHAHAHTRAPITASLPFSSRGRTKAQLEGPAGIKEEGELEAAGSGRGSRVDERGSAQ
ncbi:hypothetical protein SKAU_G00029450 [Synaphobranchus kaupii]|uniref:Uncharacterized protein n=1 Tax=Synaphobranchus kaupii TaxID=118154 RepID=A0A9Q1JFK9_SYNKA|nr:hypothetical protein SKAU_G00029450 [Synaphobranchus kaupii]